MTRRGYRCDGRTATTTPATSPPPPHLLPSAAAGSVVWCRQGFPYWPARVDLPAVIDRDIHRLRAEHFLFVRFYGWRQRGDLWSMLITCSRGTRAS